MRSFVTTGHKERRATNHYAVDLLVFTDKQKEIIIHSIIWLVVLWMMTCLRSVARSRAVLRKAFVPLSR